MPLFQVFHHDPTLSRHLAFREDAFKLWPLGYRRVAVVEAPELGAVFELTNHIDSNWTEGPAVVTLDDPRARSTSVGDVILDADDNLHGVAGIGFTPLGKLRRCWGCAKPVYDWGENPSALRCASCADLLRAELGAKTTAPIVAREIAGGWTPPSPLESSPDAAAEWDIDARMAEAAEKDKS